LARADGGPDAAFSLEPAEFRAMVDSIRKVEKALGIVSYGRTSTEQENMIFRRSLFVVRDMTAGEVFTAQNLRVIRPGNGLAPRYLENILGKRATHAIGRGTPLSWDLVGGQN
jgi:N-acetylneuraminate synthase